MALKYSVVLNVLTTGDAGCSVWEHPHKVLEAIAEAGYDGVDMDAEPDRVDRKQFHEVRDLAFSLGLKVPALLGAWALWRAARFVFDRRVSPHARRGVCQTFCGLGRRVRGSTAV